MIHSTCDKYILTLNSWHRWCMIMKMIILNFTYIYIIIYIYISILAYFCLCVWLVNINCYPDSHLKVAGLRTSFRVFRGKSHLSQCGSVAGGRCAYLHEIKKLNWQFATRFFGSSSFGFSVTGSMWSPYSWLSWYESFSYILKLISWNCRGNLQIAWSH